MRAHSYRPPSTGNTRLRCITTSAAGVKKVRIANNQKTTCEGPAFTAVPM